MEERNYPKVNDDCRIGSDGPNGAFCDAFNLCLDADGEGVNATGNSTLRGLGSRLNGPCTLIGTMNATLQCYNSSAVCKKQTDGKCAWTKEGTFAECLESNDATFVSTSLWVTLMALFCTFI